MNKWVFIINPVAGNGKGMRKWRIIEPDLSFPFSTYYTTGPKDAVRLAEECARNGATIIVGVGGDGTLHEIVEGVSLSKQKECMVSAISGGSGNDFGRVFSTFRTAKELNDAFSKRSIGFPFDLGKLETKDSTETFTNNAGLGFDAYIAYHVNRSSVKKTLNNFGLGKLAYTFFVMKALIHFPLFQLTVTENDTTHVFENVWLATLSNQPFFGGGMKISPHSNPCDGFFELTIVANIPRWKLLLVFGSVYFGKHTTLKEVHTFQAKHFSLVTNTSTFRHVDGEFAGMTMPNELDYFKLDHLAVTAISLASS